MPAKRQSDNGHHQQRQNLRRGAVGAHKGHQQHKGDDQRREVQLMTVRQHQRLRGHLAAQLAEGHDGAGKGHRTDEDAEEHFGQMNIDQNLLHAGFMLQVAVKTHQHRRKADEAVQHRHQLRHFGHFNFLRQTDTDGATDNHRQQDPRDVAAVRPQDGGDQRDRHPGNAEVVALLRGLVF